MQSGLEVAALLNVSCPTKYNPRAEFMLCTPSLFIVGRKKPGAQRAVTLIGHSSQCLPLQNPANAGKTIQ